jgi:restriction endonuclease S subunit
LKLLLRSNFFKQLLNTKTSGIGKSRVKIDEFLSIKIPLPSLEKQKKILENYNAKIELAKAQEQEAKKIEESIEEFFNEQIGIKVNNTIKAKRFFLQIMQYVDIDKWGVDKILTQSKIIYTKNHTKKPIKEICKVGSGGTPKRSKQEYYQGNIPWIKTGEVINEIIYDTEEKITEEAIANSSAKLYPKNSLIIAMYGQGLTRGRTAKLGVEATTNQACAVLHEIDNTIIDTDYLWLYLINEYHRLRELASGNNQPNLNADMIKNYKVVIPDLKIQEKIVKDITKRKEQIKKLKNEAQKNRELAIKEFEREIFQTESEKVS